MNLFTLTTGLICSVTFVKRTTGEVRVMKCRTGVTKYLKGGTTYDFASKGLLSVFDMEKCEYRCIPLANITHINGVEVCR